MGKKKIAAKYGLENDELEVTLKEETPGSEIVDKKAVQQAIQEGIKAAQERTPEETEKMKQLVTVLESIRASLENVNPEQNTDDTVKITKTAVDALLVSNDMEPLEESENISVTKENISKRISTIKKSLTV